jgi:hypothetical protein
MKTCRKRVLIGSIKIYNKIYNTPPFYLKNPMQNVEGMAVPRN